MAVPVVSGARAHAIRTVSHSGSMRSRSAKGKMISAGAGGRKMSGSTNNYNKTIPRPDVDYPGVAPEPRRSVKRQRLLDFPPK